MPGTVLYFVFYYVFEGLKQVVFDPRPASVWDLIPDHAHCIITRP